MSPTPAQRRLRDDPRTAEVAAREIVPLPLRQADALLRTLGSRERVIALYHQGLGYAALTTDALILLNGETPARVDRPLVVMRPAHGAASRVDVSVEGRRITVWGSLIDPSGDLLPGTGNVGQASTADDPRLAAVVAGEKLSLPADHKKALLAELGPGESVRSLYHCGWGYAALTGRGLVLLRSLMAPKATRVPEPVSILRREHGILDSTVIVVDGKEYKLHGSTLDPKGELLAETGEMLPMRLRRTPPRPSPGVGLGPQTPHPRLHGRDDDGLRRLGRGTRDTGPGRRRRPRGGTGLQGNGAHHGRRGRATPVLDGRDDGRCLLVLQAGEAFGARLAGLLPGALPKGNGPPGCQGADALRGPRAGGVPHAAARPPTDRHAGPPGRKFRRGLTCRGRPGVRVHGRLARAHG